MVKKKERHNTGIVLQFAASSDTPSITRCIHACKHNASVKQTPLEERGSKAQSERETRGEYQKAIIAGREMRVWLTSREATPSRFTTNQLIAGKLWRSYTIELLHTRTLARLCGIRSFWASRNCSRSPDWFRQHK